MDVDAELMSKVARGDRAAFAQLFDRHHGAVVRFAYRFVGSQARAEEVAQDVFVKVFRNAKSYVPGAKFQTFLFRVATNHCLNEVRRSENRNPSETLEDETQGAPVQAWGPDEMLEARELEAAVSVALSKMSDRERAAFVMCRFEGMKYREIGEALSASEPAVKSLIHRATLVMAQTVEALKSGMRPGGSAA